MENEWTYRHYDPFEDFDLAVSWCAAHGRLMVCPEWLSDIGFILCYLKEPVIFFWLYCDPSCSVVFIDWVITKPGTPLSVLKEGIVYSLNAPIKWALRQCRANTVISRSPAAMARVMTRADRWKVRDKELMSMSYVFTEEELR